MNDMLTILERWQLDGKAVRERMYGAATPRERERWHAIWLFSLGWPAARVADALERDAHTIGQWVEALRQKGPAAVAFEQAGGAPPPSTRHSKRS
jgi:transposase